MPFAKISKHVDGTHPPAAGDCPNCKNTECSCCGAELDDPEGVKVIRSDGWTIRCDDCDSEWVWSLEHGNDDKDNWPWEFPGIDTNDTPVMDVFGGDSKGEITFSAPCCNMHIDAIHLLPLKYLENPEKADEYVRLCPNCQEEHRVPVVEWRREILIRVARVLDLGEAGFESIWNDYEALPEAIKSG